MRPSSKSSWPAPVAMWTMPLPSSSETSSQGITRWSTSPPGRGRRRGRGSANRRARPQRALDECLLRVARNRDPLAALALPVLGVGFHGRSDVGGQRPRRRRPDDQRLVLSVEEWEADVERGIAALLVDAGLGQLVLRERRAAPGAPLRRAMAEIQRSAPVNDLQETPDVLDVRVAEGEVVGPPVHPLAQPDRPLGQRARRPDDHLAAPPCELREPELLDLTLRVEPELALDADLDPEPLAVESVLVALVEAAERLVALEDVLQRATPSGVDSEHVPVGRHGAVDEAELRAAPVLLAELREGALALPDVEELGSSAS